MIRVQHVSKAFGPRLILKNISASFTPGSISLITGGNGSGKTTLLRLLAGLARPTAGQITRNPDARIGYLGHATFLYPALTALETLRFWTSASGKAVPEKTLLKMLGNVGLSAHAYSRAGVFSRGMKQRLNLARILLLAPDILLLDEPSTGLDTDSRQLLEEEILRAKERNACIVWVSHDTEHDAPFADRVLRIKARTLTTVSPDPGESQDTGGEMAKEETCAC